MQGMFEVLSANFKPKHEIILSLQYSKLIMEQSENAEEWMGHLRLKANEYGYKETRRKLKEKFIHNINDDGDYKS